MGRTKRKGKYEKNKRSTRGLSKGFFYRKTRKRERKRGGCEYIDPLREEGVKEELGTGGACLT